MKEINVSYALAGLIVASGMIVSLSIFSYAALAQTAASNANNSPTIQGITFPVQALGNCSSESDCRAYCNDSSHMQACIAFAESHGLMNKQDAERAQGFAQALQSGGGPGGCTSPDQCAAYCSDITHIDACISFAKAHGINDDHVAQGEKISAYIKAGGKMPGGCTSEDSCKAYCGDFSHAEECYQFAKSAGIAQTSGQAQTSPGGASNGENPTPDQLQKLSELAQAAQTPGGCKTKDDCQTYCSDSSHLDECLAFGVKAGFMTQAQADMIKSTGGKGPGGCDSQQSCQVYCNDSSHQEECFKFAEEHGFINKNDEQQIQNGVVQLRSGLEQAPPEVAACIKSVLGPSVLDQIESGQLVPGPDIGNQVRSCFDKFGHTENPGQMFNHLPDQVLSCVKDKLGSDFDKIQSGTETPTPEMADTVHVCFQGMQLQQEGPNGEQGQSNGEQNIQNGQGPNFQNFLQTAPPEIAVCLQQALGDDFDKLKSGEEQPGPDILQKVQSCFSNFHPMPQNGNTPSPPYQGSSTTNYMPPGYQGSSTPYSGYNGQSGAPPQPCPQGQYWNGNTCVQNNYPPPGSYSSSTQYPSCQSGQYWNGSTCITYSTSSNGGYNNQPPPSSMPCASGQYWNGTSCVSSTTDPATACTQSGGTWTGTTCQMPSSTSTPSSTSH